MAIRYNPSGLSDNIKLCIDAGNVKSYPGSGTSITDLCTSTVGSLVNGPTYSSTNSGNLVFDGINDYGVVNISTTTVNCGEVWIYLSANVTPEADMSTTTGIQFASFSYEPGGAYSGAYDGFTLGSWTGGANNETIGYFHGGNSFRFITDTVFAGWHQIGINWNSSSLSYDIFVDGAIKTTYNAHSFWGNIGQFTTTKVTIGSGTAAASQYFFNGKVSVARLYNVPLTSQQILNNFNSLRGRYGI